jgi:hypothetical protein
MPAGWDLRRFGRRQRSGVLWLVAIGQFAPACGSRTPLTGLGFGDVDAAEPPNGSTTDASDTAADHSSPPPPADGSPEPDASLPPPSKPWPTSPDGGARWRGTTAPFFCDAGNIESRGLWSDQRGIFILTTLSTGESISLNVGKGWGPFFSREKGLLGPHLTGIADGPLVEFSSSTCAIQFISNGVAVCSAASSSVDDVFVVRDNLAYAIEGNRVLRYDGVMWAQLGWQLPQAPTDFSSRIWANEDVVVIASSVGAYVFRPENGAPSLQTNLPFKSFSSAWGFASSDIWLGTSSGALVHVTNRDQPEIVNGDPACGPIRGMWGAGDSLYFYTRTSVGVLRAGVATLLMRWACDDPARVMGLWGNGPDEVFVTVRDPALFSNACSDGVVLVYDGSSISRL